MSAPVVDAPVHRFDNGIRVYRHHLIAAQQARYAAHNLHEPEEESWFVDLLRRQPPGGLVLDLGAAIGYYVILAKNICPQIQVRAYEPLLQHREYLRANLALNGLDPASVRICPEAVAAQVGVACFRPRDFSSALVARPPAPRAWTAALAGWRRMVRGRAPADDGPPMVEVPTTTLDAEISPLDAPVDLVKVDVQGFELEVLRGAAAAMQKKRVRAWLIGTHSPELHQGCLNLLRARGYSICFESAQPQNQPDGIVAAVLE